MPFASSQQSYDDMLRRLRIAVSWLESMHVHVPGTRIQKYETHISSLLLALREKRVDAFAREDIFQGISNSFYEAAQLIFIHEGLALVKPTGGMKKRLHRLMHGPDSTIAEQPDGKSHKPRDFGFELSVASLFAKAGFAIDLDQSADVIAHKGANTFFVECKRPRGKNSLEAAMKEASSQLARRLRPARFKHDHFGFIAASLDLILHHKQGTIIAPARSVLMEAVKHSVCELISQYKASWQDVKHPNIIGALFFVQGPVICSDEQMLSRFVHLGGNNTVALSSNAGRIFSDVLRQIGEAMLPSGRGS